MHYKQIVEARALATPVAHAQTANDTSPAFVVQYVPDKGTGGSAATIALVQDSDMTFLVDGEAPSGTDAIGTAGVIDTQAAGYDTVGELVNYINGQQAWRAYALARPEAGCESLLAKSAASCIGDNGLTFYADTSAAEYASIPISGEKFVNNGINGHVKDYADKCENSLLWFSCNANMASNGTFTIYAAKQGETSSVTIVPSQTLTDATALEKGDDYPNEIWCRAPRGYRLILEAAHATDIGTLTSFYAVGKTAVLKNNRTVEETNY